MSKAIYIVHRSKILSSEEVQDRLYQICERLTPDNLSGEHSHTIHMEADTAMGVSLSTDSSKVQGRSILIGKLYEDEKFNWETVGGVKPDGSYALIRADSALTELVTDGLATRTLWYYKDKDWFICSTSQRAIIQWIGTFEFNRAVVPWMLSTGALGPEFSWDKRIMRVKPNSSVVLDKKNWVLTENWQKIVFKEKNISREEHKKELSNSIRQTFEHLSNLDFNKWLLPLSGGYDSRAILCLLKKRVSSDKINTVTWGDKAALEVEGNDAKIATELAEILDVKNQYFYTDKREESIDTVLNRFLRCGEGRTDRVAGYIDGMKIWKSFYENGTEGIIRGDEAFGWLSINSYESVIHLLEFTTCNDFSNLAHICEKYNFPKQEIPDYIARSENESLENWRDRLYQTYRIPTKLAAMSDIKLSYVEVITPFLSKRILETVRQLPSELRSDKKLFTEVSDEITPDFPIASLGANTNLKNVLSNNEVIQHLLNEIQSEKAESIFDMEFIDFVKQSIERNSKGPNNVKKQLKKYIAIVLPKAAKRWIRKKAPLPKLSSVILLFRVYIIVKMVNILTEDARAVLIQETNKS